MALRSKPRAGSRRQPETTRAAILGAAACEFAAEGAAGARTDAIARAAGVNKALLYYYFRDKETLYGAALDYVFAGARDAVAEALARPLPPREKLLVCAAAHFDYLAANRLYPRLVMRELMRIGRRPPSQVRDIVGRHFSPLFVQFTRVIREGIAAGEFRPVDPVQFVISMVALNVFYFIGAPVLHALTGNDPLEPERLAARRAAVLDFLSAALFSRDKKARRAAEGARP
ncbi:MAG: TetR/AcrR family transcriptional regulator [Terriglobales bacterium]